MDNPQDSQKMAFWSPEAKIEMTGAEFGALSQVLDLALNPLGNYSLGDIITLLSMAKEARNAVLIRMEQSGQITSEIPSAPVQDFEEPTKNLAEEPQDLVTEVIPDNYQQTPPPTPIEGLAVGGDFDIDKLPPLDPDTGQVEMAL